MLRALLPNPWVLLALLLLWWGSVVSAYLKGQATGRESQRAEQAKIEAVATQVREDAQQGAADAIAKIKIVNTTIQQRIQKEVYTSIVYRDCKHTPDGLRAVNQALTGGADPTPAGGVRRDLPPDGRLFRGDKPQASRVGKQP